MRGRERIDAYNDCMDAAQIAEQACGYKITLPDLVEEWKKEQTRQPKYVETICVAKRSCSSDSLGGFDGIDDMFRM